MVAKMVCLMAGHLAAMLVEMMADRKVGERVDMLET